MKMSKGRFGTWIFLKNLKTLLGSMAQLFIDLGARLEIWWIDVPCNELYIELMQARFE
jgi:hypothetical protein